MSQEHIPLPKNDVKEIFDEQAENERKPDISENPEELAAAMAWAKSNHLPLGGLTAHQVVEVYRAATDPHAEAIQEDLERELSIHDPDVLRKRIERFIKNFRERKASEDGAEDIEKAA